MPRLSFPFVSPLVLAIILLSGGIALPVTAKGQEEKLSDLKSSEPIIYGAYDPASLLDGSSALSIEHVFLHWQQFNISLFRKSVDKLDENRRILLVTIEPFTKAPNWRDGGEKLFHEIVTGHYESEIVEFCNSVAEISVPVWIRWGHEMDDYESERYPWARTDSRGYVQAFRYFVDRCRRIAPGSKYVWSPTGLRPADQYYPGDQYVDFVGVSLYSLEAWDLDNLGRPSSPKEVLRSRYDRVAGFGKPIIVAEVGVSGSPHYVKEWLVGLREQTSYFSMLRAIVYFNARETGSWEYYGLPDWRLSTQLWQEVLDVPRTR